MTEMDDGWVEVPAIHEPIVWTRFEKTSRMSFLHQLLFQGHLSWRVELQQPNVSGTRLAPPPPISLSIGFHKIRGPAWRLLTIPSSRRLPKQVSTDVR